MDKTDKLEACPWCEAAPQKTDLAPSQRYRLVHKPTCYLYGRMADMRGNSRYIFIAASQVEAWNSRASVAAPPPRELYSELIHVAAELVRGDGFLSPCAEDLAPKLKRADVLQTARRQEERLKDWAMRIRRVADQLSSPVAATVDAETPVRCVHCGATEHSYQQDWDHPFESLAVTAPSLGSSIQAAPRHYFCSCGGALTAEEYIEHYFEKGHDHGEPELLIRAAAAEIGER